MVRSIILMTMGFTPSVDRQASAHGNISAYPLDVVVIKRIRHILCLVRHSDWMMWKVPVDIFLVLPKSIGDNYIWF